MILTTIAQFLIATPSLRYKFLLVDCLVSTQLRLLVAVSTITFVPTTITDGADALAYTIGKSTYHWGDQSRRIGLFRNPDWCVNSGVSPSLTEVRYAHTLFRASQGGSFGVAGSWTLLLVFSAYLCFIYKYNHTLKLLLNISKPNCISTLPSVLRQTSSCVGRYTILICSAFLGYNSL